jgi:predicted transcriptional regulator
MRDSEIEVLDEESLELVRSLRALGMTRNEAPLIAYLSGVEMATSREIEAGTGLRQPEVSIGMKMLRSRDWIRDEEIRSEKKGRPTKVYTLKVALAEIVKYLEEEKAHDANQAMTSIQKLRELAPSL